jgi:small subunit ribosomal protein S1
LVKEDGTTAEKGEKLPFKVLEFNKDAKKIMLSHTQIFKEVEEEAKKKAKKKSSSAVKKVQDNIEKTTLGDIDALSALKSELEKGEGDK